MEKKTEEQKRIESLNGNHDFWQDATSLLKTLVVDNVEEKIIKHMTESKFNDNEMRLFREYLGNAFDLSVTVAFLKIKCREQK